MSNNIATQKMYRHRFIHPAAISDNAAFTSNVLDMLGKTSLTVFVDFGATDIAMAALKLQESDAVSSATALTAGTDIPGADFSVLPATLPSSTADNTTVCIVVPWTGARKRYCNLVATSGDGSTGTYMVASGLCEVAESKGTTGATGMNVAQLLKVAG